MSEVLSKRYSHLDTEVIQPDQKKQRKEQWSVLESALAEWVIREQQRRVINGDLLRLQASIFWHRLPQYNGQTEPPWSNGWLAGFKTRKGIKDRRRHGEAGGVDETTLMAELAVVQAKLSQYPLQDQYNYDETGLF